VLQDLDALKDYHGDWPRSAFLQDADPLTTKPDDLVEILKGLRERFPKVERITTYARTQTLRRKPLEDLRRVREAGLTRVHVGLESGSNRVLELIRKGVTQEDHILAGARAKEAGFELSLYVMPGVGGAALTDEHADRTAEALARIEPDFTRLRTTAAIPGTPLHDMQEQGEWEPLDDTGTVREIRRLLTGLENVRTRLESDHISNLLMHLRGNLPDGHGTLLAHCDAYLSLSDDDRRLFILGRRTGRLGRVEQLDRPGVRAELQRLLAQLREAGHDFDVVAAELRRQIL
jgi:coproporphyrinogen III oxidase-like Fe-S oxidoreductase